MKYCLILISVLLVQGARAQWVLNGDAEELGDNCFQLTEELPTQAGSVWYDSLINLEEDFEVNFEIYLGTLDASGADGIAFVLQPVSTGLGESGGGLGYEGIEPSLDIEFDTWQNGIYGDPTYDHISIMQDGILDHFAATALTPYTQILSGSTNAEDGNYHQVRITWEAGSETISCFVDCDLRVTYSGDIIDDIFDGDPFVFMGFTAATGGSYNDQIVCLDYVTAVDELDDVTVCPGDSVQLFLPEGFVSYSWSPATGVSDPTAPDPWLSPDVTTTYTVTITDECGNTITNIVTVTVGSPELVDLGPDLSLCEGDEELISVFLAGATYEWNNGSTLPAITITESGTYWVELTLGNCTDADTINVNYSPAPFVNFGLDTVVCGLSEVVFLDATNPGATYLWQDGSTSPTYTVTEDGLYFVTVSIGSCIDQDSLAVNYSSYPAVDLGPDIYLCPDSVVLLLAGPPVFVYTWQDGSSGNTYLITESGEYWVDVNSNGCITRAYIDVIDDPCICEMIVPNAFSPNNDGYNDEFRQLECSQLNRFNMKIYNRWGELMFETSDYSAGWDGTFRGEQCEMGAYVFVIEYDIIDGESGIKQGSFLLLR